MTTSGAAPEPVQAPAVPPAPSAWNIANGLTLLRLLLVPVFGWLLLAAAGDDPLLRLLAAGAFAVAAMTDRIDGQLARRRGLVTDVGKIADPIADKALMGMALVGPVDPRGAALVGDRRGAGPGDRHHPAAASS